RTRSTGSGSARRRMPGRESRRRAKAGPWSSQPVIAALDRSAIAPGVRGRTGERQVLRGAAEHRAQDGVSLADVFRTPPSRDQREDLLGLFGRHGAVLVADVGELAQRNLERDRHAVETIDGNRLLAALDLADEFPAETGPLAEAFLAERALFAQGAQTLTEKFPDVFDGALCHGTVVLLVRYVLLR